MILHHFPLDLIEKKLKIDIVTTLKMKKTQYRPKYLSKSSKDRVEVHVPDIIGKTSPPWKYGIIHSKLIVSDR